MRKYLIVPVVIAILATALQAEETKFDPTRPVSMLGQTEFTIQWSTPTPCRSAADKCRTGKGCCENET